MMRIKKKSGFWKIHQDCGVCQKPTEYKQKQLLKQVRGDEAAEPDKGVADSDPSGGKDANTDST
jgi:hypothetical protein